MLELIFPIVLEGLKIFKEERRTRIEDKYFDILEAIRRSENATGSSYSDSSIDINTEKLSNFLKAYALELRDQNEENSI